MADSAETELTLSQAKSLRSQLHFVSFLQETLANSSRFL